jgi:hypothetical protein
LYNLLIEIYTNHWILITSGSHGIHA